MRLLVVAFAALVIACSAFDDDVHVSLQAGSTAVNDTDEVTILSIVHEPPEGMAPVAAGLRFWGVEVRERPSVTFGGPGCWGLMTSGDEEAPLRPVVGEEEAVAKKPVRAGDELVRLVGFLLPSQDEPESLIYDRSCFRHCGGIVSGCMDKIYFDVE